MPHAPAVGAATILPMHALHSATDSARAMARPMTGPLTAFSACAKSLIAPPPVRPDIERRPGVSPSSLDSRITRSAWRMRSTWCAISE